MKKNKCSEMKILFHVLLSLFSRLPQLAYNQSVALKNVNFLTVWLPQPQFAGYYMAKEKGIYEKYCLEVIAKKIDYNVFRGAK